MEDENSIKRNIQNLQRKLNEGLNEFELNNISELLSEIEKHKEIINNETSKKIADRHREDLVYLENLASIHNQIEELENSLKKPDPNEIMLKDLEFALQTGMKDLEISSITVLLSKIDYLKEKLNTENRKRFANSLRMSLEDLEPIANIFLKIQKINPMYQFLPSADTNQYIASPNIGNTNPTLADTDQNIASPNIGQNVTENKRILEDLKELEKQPYCPEKSLNYMIYLIKLKMGGTDNIIDANNISIRVEQKINEECTILNNHLKPIDLEDVQIVESIKTFQIQVDYSNWQRALETLASTLRKIQPFNFQKMHSLIKKTNKSVSKLKQKEIIILFGATGSGKSTTVHYLAGSTMKQTTVNDISHISKVPKEWNQMEFF